MCNRYEPPGPDEISTRWKPKNSVENFPPGLVFPRSPGPFIRAARGGCRQLVVGQWGLVPFFAQSPMVRHSTNNARVETIDTKPTFRGPWAKGQRCIIPARSFDEPCWQTGRNVWHRFRRVDGMPWGLAGLWSTWVDKASGEVVDSYTMLMQNADTHPVMNRMHKPDPALPSDQQDKRSVVPIELQDVDRWLFGSVSDARSLIVLPPAELFLEEALVTVQAGASGDLFGP